MGQRGGKRAGAGRKPGTSRKITRTAELAEKAAAQGITPLEFMLAILRKEPDAEADPLLQINQQAMRFEAAKAAAPYVHPRLQAIEHKGPGGGPLQHNLLVEFVGTVKK